MPVERACARSRDHPGRHRPAHQLRLDCGRLREVSWPDYRRPDRSRELAGPQAHRVAGMWRSAAWHPRAR